MRRPLRTRPKLLKRLLHVARIDVLLSRHPADRVVNKPIDAVVAKLVARPEAVDIACEWPVGDASVGSDAVAAEAGDGVEDGGGQEAAGVAGFVPVPGVSSVMAYSM